MRVLKSKPGSWSATSCSHLGRLPEASGSLDRSTVYRWKFSVKNRRGQKNMLSAALLAILSEVVDRVSSQVALTTLTYKSVFKRIPGDYGIERVPSREWIRFGGFSCKQPGGNSLTQHLEEKQTENLTALRQKLEFAMEAHNVGPDRVVNIEEMSVRLLPTSYFGWSTKGEKSAQLQSSEAVVTGTVAVPMAEETEGWLQVIFQGKTHSVIPEIDEVTLGDRVQLTCAESHWQTAVSLRAFVLWLDSIMNTPPSLRDWILLMDLAASPQQGVAFAGAHSRALPSPSEAKSPSPATSSSSQLR